MTIGQILCNLVRIVLIFFIGSMVIVVLVVNWDEDIFFGQMVLEYTINACK